MKKVITLLLILLLGLPYNVVYASQDFIYPKEYYTEDGKMKVNVVSTYRDNGVPLEVVYDAFIQYFHNAVPRQEFRGMDGKLVEGTTTYPNASEAKLGLFDLQWVFTPTESDKYESKSGIVHYNLVEGEKPTVDEPTPPSLTATIVQLTKSTSYDININNKVSGSKYKWTSSNPGVAKVNAKNGLVTAVSEGTATITCEMTLPDGTVQTLSSDVVISYDDNATVLNDDELDLEIGDKYTLKVENAPKGAQYKFVSSNKSIVKVGTINGKVTAVSKGNAYVTCTITTPDKQVIVLRCDISVSE